MRVAFITSLKHIVRGRGRSLLFLLLLTALTALLFLGVGLYAESQAQLAAMDEAYTTLAVLEYCGDGYPDSWAYDTGRAEAVSSFDHSLVTRNASVLSYTPGGETLANVAGYERRSGAAPFRQSAVIVMNSIGYVKSHDIYMGQCIDSLYVFRSRDNLAVRLEMGGFDFEPQLDRTYALHGSFFIGETMIPCFMLQAFPECVDEADAVPWLDVTERVDAFLGDPPAPFAQSTDIYELMNGAVSVYALDEPEAFLPLHQQKISLSEGRYFTEEEIATGAPVCIVSDFAMSGLEVSLGDTLALTYLAYDNEKYLGTRGEQGYTIVGVMRQTPESYHSLYTPSRAIPATAEPFGYQLGTAIVRNDDANQFYTDVSESLPARCQVTMYDQGYALMSAGVKDLARTAGYLTIVCIFAALGVLVLYGFLFVYRQHESVRIMQTLGAGTGPTLVFLLTGAALLACCAAVLGALLGRLLSGRVNALVAQSFADLSQSIATYGTGNLGIRIDFTGGASASAVLPLCSALGMALAALLSTLLFARRAISLYNVHKKKPARKKTVPVVSAKGMRSSSLPGGALKFALLSVLRGGWRSAVVALVTLVLLLFLGALSASLGSYKTQLSTLAERSPMTGFFTDLSGKTAGGMALSKMDVNTLLESDSVESLSKSLSEKYKFLGVTRTAAGEEIEVPDFVPPTNKYSLETLYNRVPLQSDVFFTNDIETVPEFFFSGDMQAQYMDGCDASMFVGNAPSWPGSANAAADSDGESAVTYTQSAAGHEEKMYVNIFYNGDPLPCLVSTDFMKEFGVNYGDTIKLALDYEFYSIHLYVVGSFQRYGGKDNIYAPLCMAKWYVGPTYCAASFRLKSAAELDAFRAFLTEQKYSSVGDMNAKRTTVLVRDAEFLASRDRLTRQVRYLEILLPVLFALAGALGFVISYLMMAGRRLELAMMRSLGARRDTAFCSYFLEYLMLALAGCALAAAVWALRASLGRAELICMAVYMLCFLTGCTISILRLGSQKLLKSLADPE